MREDAPAISESSLKLVDVEVADAAAGFRLEAQGMGARNRGDADRFLLPGRPATGALHGIACDLTTRRAVDADAEDAARVRARERDEKARHLRHVDAVVAERVTGIEEADGGAVVLELRARLRSVSFRLNVVATV